MSTIKSLTVMVSILCVMFCKALYTDIAQEEKEITVIQVKEPEVIREVVEIPRVAVVHVVEFRDDIYEVELTDYEKELLATLVWHEAGNQDIVGKQLVVDCVLNRVNSEDFPDDVYSVINQPNQFVSVHQPGYYDEECMTAVEKECRQRCDYEILYFRTGHYHTFATPAYQHGDHYFSK